MLEQVGPHLILLIKPLNSSHCCIFNDNPPKTASFFVDLCYESLPRKY